MIWFYKTSILLLTKINHNHNHNHELQLILSKLSSLGRACHKQAPTHSGLFDTMKLVHASIRKTMEINVCYLQICGWYNRSSHDKITL